MDRQVDRETDGTVTVTRLSAQTVGLSSSCCGGNGGTRESAREMQPKSFSECHRARHRSVINHPKKYTKRENI